jgi:hypothetical protein
MPEKNTPSPFTGTLAAFVKQCVEEKVFPFFGISSGHRDYHRFFYKVCKDQPSYFVTHNIHIVGGTLL